MAESYHNLKPHRGTLILVFGILSLICCNLFGVAAWVMGNNDLGEMDQGSMDPEGRQITQAGKICGIIGVVLGILSIAAVFAFGGLAAILEAANM